MVREDVSAPADVVHRQTEAYNEGDAGEFAACYHDRAKVMSLEDGEVVAKGRDEIRKEWRKLFETMPEVHCEVRDQFGVDEFVACRERVTGIEEPLDVLAVYQVQDDVIQQLWLSER